MTAVLLADDQALVRVGLRKILENEPDTTVVAEAENGEEAVAAAARHRPDVVLMDIRTPALEELTPREREVLDLLARGLSNPEICERLVISEATAKTHVARILQKLDLRDRVQAVIYAYESGLVAPGAGQP